MTGKVARPARF